jgi:hypothetical protein
MMRALLYGFISILVITFIRMVLGIIMKEFNGLMKEETASQTPPQKPTSSGKQKVPTSGEFKACQTCGTYVLESGAITAGEAVYCSAACKQKAAQASA